MLDSKRFRARSRFAEALCRSARTVCKSVDQVSWPGSPAPLAASCSYQFLSVGHAYSWISRVLTRTPVESTRKFLDHAFCLRFKAPRARRAWIVGGATACRNSPPGTRRSAASNRLACCMPGIISQGLARASAVAWRVEGLSSPYLFPPTCR